PPRELLDLCCKLPRTLLRVRGGSGGCVWSRNKEVRQGHRPADDRVDPFVGQAPVSNGLGERVRTNEILCSVGVESLGQQVGGEDAVARTRELTGERSRIVVADRLANRRRDLSRLELAVASPGENVCKRMPVYGVVEVADEIGLGEPPGDC